VSGSAEVVTVVIVRRGSFVVDLSAFAETTGFFWSRFSMVTPSEGANRIQYTKASKPSDLSLYSICHGTQLFASYSPAVACLPYDLRSPSFLSINKRYKRWGMPVIVAAVLPSSGQGAATYKDDDKTKSEERSLDFAPFVLQGGRDDTRRVRQLQKSRQDALRASG
jgi:hypothetical protein